MIGHGHLVGGIKRPSLPDDRYATIAAMTYVAGTPTRRRHFLRVARPQYQSHAGSCGAHMGSFLAETDALIRTGQTYQVCRQDLYFGARLLAGDERRDAGVIPDNLYRWGREFGLLSEVHKAYDPDDVTTWRPDPSWASERLASVFGLLPIPISSDAVLSELDADRPVGICHFVYGDMVNRTRTTGIEGEPEGGSLGGHARAVVGYDLDANIPGFSPGAVLVRNWWQGWGIPHPLAASDPAYAGHRDSYSWVPLGLLGRSRSHSRPWGYDYCRVAFSTLGT